MTNELAIEQLRVMIACWEEILNMEGNKDLRGTGLELEAMRMAVQALKEKPRWIPCKERMPEMHKEEFDGDTFNSSDRLLFSSSTGVHCGYCEDLNGLMWETEEGLACEDVNAWMPLPQTYKED